MTHATRGSRAASLAAVGLVLLAPCVASAGWGDQRWGEMVWGAAASSVPSVSIEELIALAILLLVIPSALLARRRRASRQ